MRGLERGRRRRGGADRAAAIAGDAPVVDEKEMVRISVSLWAPSRLLCEPLGLTPPTTAAPGEDAGQEPGQEETYFR